MISYLFILHAISGAIAILSGFLTPLFNKQSRYHKYGGRIFYYTMLGLGVSGAVGAYFRGIPLSFLNGLLVCYFVLSSYHVIRQPAKSITVFDKFLLGGITLLTFAFAGCVVIARYQENGLLGGFSSTTYLIFGFVAFFCVVADVIYIRAGGRTGRMRLIRHLWRMFFPLFMATAAFFLGQAKLFPVELRKIEYLSIPVLFVVLCMLYWIAKVSLKPRQLVNMYSK